MRSEGRLKRIDNGEDDMTKGLKNTQLKGERKVSDWKVNTCRGIWYTVNVLIIEKGRIFYWICGNNLKVGQSF